MKKALLSILIVLGTIISYSQSKNIVGAWLWRDSKTSFSLFIKKDGTIEKHTGPINEAILEKNLVHGTYKLLYNQKLLITWADKTTESDKVKLIDKFTLQVQLRGNKANSFKTYVFKKIVDEEVALPPQRFVFPTN
jgi:hypothetical protein